MATSGGTAQEAIRAPGSKKCPKHHGKEVLFVCEDCDILVCGECVIQQHKRHGLQGIENSVPEAKQKLQDFMTRAEQIEIPRIKGKFKKVKDDLSKNKSKFQKQISLIKKRNETLKKELDKIADTMVKTCQDMEHQNSDTLVNHQKELQTQMDKLESRIQEVKASLQSGNDILVYDTSHVIPSEFEDLPTLSCSIAEFSPDELQLQELEHLLGKLNITDHHYQPSLSLSQSFRNWRVVSEFRPFQGLTVTSLHATGDVAWLSFHKTILLVNQEGQVQQTLALEVRIKDFCISPHTGNLWFCSYDDRSVREVKDKRASIKFKTNKEPLCICVTRDDNIIVGCDREVVKYTQTGQEICRTAGGTPPVVRYPRHISECPVTRHIAVADSDSKHNGGDGEPFVSILNHQFQLLHTYKGEVSGRRHPLEPFDPWDVHYTDTGNLVIIDRNNNSVVLVTGTGQYIQTLYTVSESQPVAVSEHSGTLWVSLLHGKVQVLKNN